MKSVYVLLYFLLFLVVFLAVFIFLRLSDYSEYQVQDYGSLIITGFIFLEIVLIIIFLILSINSIFRLNIIRKKRLFKAFLRLFILSWILRYVFIPFMHIHYLFMAAFLLLFFASFLIPIFYLWKNADELFPQVRLDEEGGIDLLLFCSQNGISKRESQIIEQICLGKTNKQIAETLFISLQTVKDHTHRIYTKIGINSRMQLLQMVKSN